MGELGKFLLTLHTGLNARRIERQIYDNTFTSVKLLWDWVLSLLFCCVKTQCEPAKARI